jgi:hypothetical protein
MRAALSPLLLLTALALGGCASRPPVPPAPVALKCVLPAGADSACPTPQPLKAGLTYRELLEAHLADRQQLQRCAAQHEELRRVVAACSARIDALSRPR